MEKENEESTIIYSPSTRLINDDQSKSKGHYAENLAYVAEDNASSLALSSPVVVYTKLSVEDESSTSNKSYFIWKAILSGCTLAACVICVYFLLNARFIATMFSEVYTENEQPPIAIPVFKDDIDIFTTSMKSQWNVENDLPPGIQLVTLYTNDMKSIINIKCPSQKFGLVLYQNSEPAYAENWLKACSDNIAYFRVDGTTSKNDVVQLLTNLNSQTQYLPLKASLYLEKGEDIENIPSFQLTKMSNEIINSVEITGFVNVKSLTSLMAVVPYIEKLAFKGDDVCKNLRRAPKTSNDICMLDFNKVEKLSFVQTQDCRGLYDLIYSCWNMPSLKAFEMRKSIVSGINAKYIGSILDKQRITKVDFADNVCFDDTIEKYPFMCQPSK